MISLMTFVTAAALAASLKVPLLIVQGERDLQVTDADARALAAARPKARLVVIPAMNHVLKDVRTADRAANLATYGDPSLAVDATLVDTIAQFVRS